MGRSANTRRRARMQSLFPFERTDGPATTKRKKTGISSTYPLLIDFVPSDATKRTFCSSPVTLLMYLRRTI